MATVQLAVPWIAPPSMASRDAYLKLGSSKFNSFWEEMSWKPTSHNRFQPKIRPAVKCQQSQCCPDGSLGPRCQEVLLAAKPFAFHCFDEVLTPLKRFSMLGCAPRLLLPRLTSAPGQRRMIALATQEVGDHFMNVQPCLLRPFASHRLDSDTKHVYWIQYTTCTVDDSM